jgi:hypothetical protein
MAFMRALLEVLSTPVVITVPAEPDPELQAKLSAARTAAAAHPMIIVDAGPPELEAITRDFEQFVAARCVVEPSIAGTAVYLPREANQRYTPSEVRVLSARMLSLAYQIERRSAAR